VTPRPRLQAPAVCFQSFIKDHEDEISLINRTTKCAEEDIDKFSNQSQKPRKESISKEDVLKKLPPEYQKLKFDLKPGEEPPYYYRSETGHQEV
jgi:hypothetical protein